VNKAGEVQIPGDWIFFMKTPNICGLALGNLRNIALVAPVILRCRLDFWKMYRPTV
jgi:hypothetical protein